MKAFCSLVGVLCVSSAAVAAEPPAWYVAGHLGTNTLDNWPATVDFGGVPVSGRLALERGRHMGLMLGRESEHARVELEWGHGRIKVDTIELAGVSEHAGAQGKYDVLLANLYRHDALSENLRAFGALGIGWGRAELPLLKFSSGCECLGPASRSGAAYQARLGLGYQLAPGHALSLQYSHLSLVGPRRGGLPSVEYGRRSFGAWSAAYTHYF